MKVTIESPSSQIYLAVKDSYNSGKPINIAGQYIHINGWTVNGKFIGMGPSDMEIDAEPLPDKSPTVEELQHIINDVSALNKLCGHSNQPKCKQHKNIPEFRTVLDNSWKRGLPVEFPTGLGVLIVPEQDVNGVVIVMAEDGGYRRIAASSIKPIKTEREKFVEAAAMVIDQCAGGDARFIAGEMFDSGEFKYQPKEKGQ